MIKYIQTQDPSDCCGCRACEQICTHKALHFEEDKEGFFYPVLNATLCVDCGLCSMVCPLMNPEKVQHKEEGDAYAAQYLKQGDLKTSSSGGGFIAIAKYVLNKGGVVYGAAYQNGPIVVHQRVDNFYDLEKLKGSKYMQSDTCSSYSLIKKDLKDGCLVYFTGTPCQVAGLKLFLRMEYENLITSDLICHGTPSLKIFQNTVSHIETQLNADFKDYSFRDKKVRGWSCCSSSSYKSRSNGKIIYLNYSKDMEAYFNAFISGHLMRMNCYKCPFASHYRCGDITLADFWGVRKKMPDFPDIYKGVSLLIANSEKGKLLMSELNESFYMRSVSMEDAIATNANLRKPTPFAEERKKSYVLAFNDYPSFIKRYYKGNYLINNLKIQIEYFIRKHEWLFALISNTKKTLK